MEVMLFCVNNNIHLLGLPPNCTHLLQPLDLGVFGPLKSHAAVARMNFAKQVPLGAHNFLRAITPAILLALTQSNIVGAFKSAKLLPWDPAAAVRKIEKKMKSKDVDKSAPSVLPKAPLRVPSAPPGWPALPPPKNKNIAICVVDGGKTIEFKQQVLEAISQLPAKNQLPPRSNFYHLAPAREAAVRADEKVDFSDLLMPVPVRVSAKRGRKINVSAGLLTEKDLLFKMSTDRTEPEEMTVVELKHYLFKQHPREHKFKASQLRKRDQLRTYCVRCLVCIIRPAVGCSPYRQVGVRTRESECYCKRGQ